MGETRRRRGVITVLGQLLTELGHRHGRTSACSALQVRHQQAPVIPLNVEHGELEVGQVVGLHRRHNNLWAICEADADELLDFDGAVYYSAETDMAADGSDVLVTAVALTAQPAAVAIQPVQMYRGAVAEAVFRTSFGRDNYWLKEILEQTLEQRYKRRAGDAIYVSYPPVARPSEYVSRGSAPSRGPIRHSPWRGKILSVR
jgi:hypothetical protein